MDESTARRIILLGKTGSGKSSLANTIFGEDVFKISHLPVSEITPSQVETKAVNGKSLTIFDTCSFFDTGCSEASVNTELLRCITECSPGPHAFLIVLKVERFTKQEQDVIEGICQRFSEEALKHAAVVFTHGDQLPEGLEIQGFVSQNDALRDLVSKCGGRCHVVDNKYWKNKGEDDNRSNQFHVGKILSTIDEIIKANQGCYYTNEMLKAVKKEIQIKEEMIDQSSENKSREQSRKEAKKSVFDSLVIGLAGAGTGVLLGAFLGLRQSNDIVQVLDAARRGGAEGFMIGLTTDSPHDAIQRTTVALLKSLAE